MTTDPSIASTTPPRTPDPMPWQPRGHLVGSAAALLAVTVVVLGASAAFGLLTPRVSTNHSLTWGPESAAADTVFATFEVSNDAYATARLVGADASVPGMRVASVTLSPLDGRSGRTDGSVDLRHGESAQVTIRWRVTDCGLVPADPGPIGLELRTPVGLTRTVDATSVSELIGASPADASDPGWALVVAHGICPT